MDKLLTSKQVQALDRATVEREPIASLDLMERASARFARAFRAEIEPGDPIYVLAGSGNNGGDGCAVARLLAAAGHPVRVVVVRLSPTGSPDFEANRARLDACGVPVAEPSSPEAFPEPGAEERVIDALFGSGLNRPPEGLAAHAIAVIRAGGHAVYAIDAPSGLMAEGPPPGPNALPARRTWSFGGPKPAFLMPDRGFLAGDWSVLDIGLDRDAWLAAEPLAWYATAGDLRGVLPPRARFAHKYAHGHVLVGGGKAGTRGAAWLAATAALRAGAGLVSVAWPDPGAAPDHHPGQPELMHLGASREAPLPDRLSAVVLGPGLGTAADGAALLDRWLGCGRPLVLDADALNLLAGRGQSPPPGAVLTPHPGEYRRLFGDPPPGLEAWERLRAEARTTGCTLVLKGAHTAIAAPDGRLVLNGTGHPALATAGSGDVLSGIIGALLAQGLPPFHAAWIGVAWHGLAGERAAAGIGPAGVLAGDLPGYLPGLRGELLAGDSPPHPDDEPWPEPWWCFPAPA